MIKSIVDFIKNLFSSKEPEPVKEKVSIKLNTETNWPFPTERPATVTAEVVPVLEPMTAEVVPQSNKASTTSPAKRKKRKPVKTATPAVAATTPKPVKSAAPPPPVKLSPGPVTKRKPKAKVTKKQYIMKVYISKYRNHWLSPYTILEWVTRNPDLDYDLPWVRKWSDRLEPLSKGLQKVLDWIHPRVEYVKIDKWDTWSMDTTLAPIILPMLIQLRDTKHGSPCVDMEDVPEYMRTTSTEDWDSQLVFDFYNAEDDTQKCKCDLHTRWSWVLDEMIFAFQGTVDNSWEDKYRSGEHDLISAPCEWDDEGKPTLYLLKEGPNNTYKCDYEGMRKEQERIDNGLRLFGKYYRGLWD